MTAEEASASSARSATRRGARLVIERILRWIDPEDNPSSVVYGIITVGAVLAAESVHATDGTSDILATIVILLVYWLAHSYSASTGIRLDGSTTWSWPLVRSTLRREWAIIRGAAGPIVVMIIAAALGATPFHVDVAGLITALVLLVGFELLAGLRAHLRPVELVIQGLGGALLGVLILVARAILV